MNDRCPSPWDDGVAESDIMRAGKGLLEPEQLEHLAALRARGGNSASGPAPQELRNYDEAQGRINFAFLQTVVSKLVYPTLEVTTKVSESRTTATLTVDDVGMSFRVRDSETEQGKMSVETTEDLSGIRGAVIWLEREFNDVLSVDQGPDSRHTEELFNKLSVDTTEVVVPYVIAGVYPAEKNESSNMDEALLLPLYGLATHEERGGSTPSTVYRERFSHSKYGILSDEVSIGWVPHVAKVQLYPGKIDKLKGLQEQVIQRGFSEEEKNMIYSDGSLVISPRHIPVFEAKDTNPRTLRFRLQPRRPEDLGTEDVDLDIKEDYTDTIPPEVFRLFKVITSLHRSAAMLGRGQAFEDAHQDYIDHSLVDPRS